MEKCRELVWIGRSLRDFNSFPARVAEELLLELRAGMSGEHPTSAKPLKGFGGATVLELKNSDASGTFRVIYTVRFGDKLCVLHAFQKKSSSGIATARQDLDIIKQRLARAEREYRK